MNAGDADVPNAMDPITHRFRRQGRFLRNWDIAGAGRYNYNGASAQFRAIPLDSD